MSKLINQGSYGCVYHPSLLCSGRPSSNNKLVSKLQARSWSTTNEIEIGKIIMEIENYHLYFLPVTQSCDIDISSVDNNLISNCKVVNKHKKRSQSEFVLTKMKYLENISFIKYLQSSNTTPRYALFKIMQSYKSLATGLKILNDNEIVHHDLNHGNILFDATTGIPIIIDFGLAINMADFTPDNKALLNEHFFVDAPDYWPWSLDVHIINYIVQRPNANDNANDTASDNIEIDYDELINIANKWVDALPIIPLFSRQFKDQFVEKCYAYLEQFIGKTHDEAFSILMQHYKTWDNYALNMLFLSVIHSTFKDKIPNTNFISEFIQLTLINISPDPTERMSYDETINYISEITSRENSAEDITQTLSSVSISDR